MKLPTIYELKPAFQSLLRPLVKGMASKGITANQVTVAAMLISALQGGWLASQPGNPLALLFLPLVLFLRMALNAIDGMLAREHNQKSRLGGFLNEMGDVLSDTALYLPMALHPDISPILIISFVILSILTELTGVLAIQACGERRYDGPMGKSDRAFLWGTVGFIAFLGIPLQHWINYLIALSIFLLVVTILNRTRRALG